MGVVPTTSKRLASKRRKADWLSAEPVIQLGRILVRDRPIAISLDTLCERCVSVTGLRLCGLHRGVTWEYQSKLRFCICIPGS